MSLLGGDLTTPSRVKVWIPNLTAASDAIIAQLITSMTALIYNKLNRSRLFSQQFVRTFDGTGNYQLVLPDWPVTSIMKVQMGAQLILPSPLPNPTTGAVSSLNPGYGYRAVLWEGNPPGDPAILEFNNGGFSRGAQNIQVTYVAGYLIQNEAATIPITPFQVTVQQPQGIWCRDGGVTYASSGIALVPVTGPTPTIGQYVPPPDTSPGLYTFAAADVGKAILISYSYIPAELEEACIQMVAERNSYRQRIGELSKSLGGQETVSFLRGSGVGRSGYSDLPPEVEGLIWPYVSVISPALGAPT